MSILKQALDNAKDIVFFTGAGISVPSGIPDFRSYTGLYHQNLRAETILSHSFFMDHPKAFYDFYWKHMVYPQATPNKAHQWISDCQRDYRNVTVITQNIDGLHQKAGSRNVIELHGSIHHYTCMRCGHHYTLDDLTIGETPYCPLCHGLIKPDVVLYDEALDQSAIHHAILMIQQCDTLIIIGTSLNVYPAAGFIQYFTGSTMVLINKSTTPMDQMADILIHDDIIHVIDAIQH